MSKKSEFLILGCGLPRTGTMSLKIALEKLLGGKCYHMTEAYGDKTGEHAEFWTRFCDGEVTEVDEMREFFLTRGYVAAIDFPASLFYKYEHIVQKATTFLIT